MTSHELALAYFRSAAMMLGWYSEPGHISYDGRKSASVVNWYSENWSHFLVTSPSLFSRVNISA